MIEMIKSNTDSFLLKADIQGIEKMLMYINAVSEKSEEYIQILYSGKEKSFSIKLDPNVDDMFISEDIIEIYMDEEELEYFEERLKNSLLSKCFYPAEMFERRYNNKYVTIYCNIIIEQQEGSRMNYYILNPEVAGELGEGSELVYENGKIKEVNFLEYNFMGWQGDELLSTHPCFIVTEDLKNDIIVNDLTGVTFKKIAMTFSDEFYDTYGNKDLPQFVQIVCKTPYEDNADDLQYDFYYNKYKEIIVSEKALSVLKGHKIDQCIIEAL